MEIGLNLSFAAKRFLVPEQLARLCAETFGISHVQLTWDLINPWWPAEQRDILAARYKAAFDRYGIAIDSTFGGVASYSYAQLLSPSEEERQLSVQFFKRAVDLTVSLGATVMGSPVGAFSYGEERDNMLVRKRYAILLDELRELAAYGETKGLRELQIEATPLTTELLYTPERARRLMTDLDGTTAIPVTLLIDWGHALFDQIPDTIPSMEHWLTVCAPYVGGIHLQQTDGKWDRHWDFSRKGLVTPELVRQTLHNAHMENVPQYLEVVTIFEDFDDRVLDGMRTSMELLHTAY